MDALYTSERILISNDNYQDLKMGGILVDHSDGTIKRIFTSQEEINSYLFMQHGAEAIIGRESWKESEKWKFSNFVVHRFMILARKWSCRDWLMRTLMFARELTTKTFRLSLEPLQRVALRPSLIIQCKHLMKIYLKLQVSFQGSQFPPQLRWKT